MIAELPKLHFLLEQGAMAANASPRQREQYGLAGVLPSAPRNRRDDTLPVGAHD